MVKHVSDGERLAIASLNRKEAELILCKRENENLRKQLKALTSLVSELKASRKILCNQINYLVTNKS